MAINALIVDWLSRLNTDYGIFEDASVFDLGPQDLMPSARDKFYPPLGEDEWGREVYLRLGARDYAAADLGDPRARFCDFNSPPRGEGLFDVVTNFGTSEHVINQSAVFRFLHESARTGGAMLHVLPVAGGIDHGFFNYQPAFFLDLAEANGYEILDAKTFPFYAVQAEFGVARVELTLERKRSAVKDLGIVARRSLHPRRLRDHLNHCASQLRSSRNPVATYFQGRYVHFAVRKMGDDPFVNPIQRKYRKRAKSASV